MVPKGPPPSPPHESWWYWFVPPFYFHQTIKCSAHLHQEGRTVPRRQVVWASRGIGHVHFSRKEWSDQRYRLIGGLKSKNVRIIEAAITSQWNPGYTVLGEHYATASVYLDGG